MLVKKFPWLNPAIVFSQVKDFPHSIFLDSSLNNQLGRYSLIATSPFCRLKSKNNLTEIIQNGKTKTIHSNPFDVLKNLLRLYGLKTSSDNLPFHGGVIGYFGYDLLHHLEKIPRNAIDDLKIPDCALGFYDSALVFDHFKNEVYVVSLGLSKNPFENFKTFFKNSSKKEEHTRNKKNLLSLKSNFTKKQYLKTILQAKHYIKEGDIYQVNLSQRFETFFSDDPWNLYRSLRQNSPSAFSGYLNFGEFQILCSSPERFLKVTNNLVETRPMKGTRARGINACQDLKLRNELLKSKKDNAELLMITDLLRNDLGKVCNYSTVKVKSLRNLESYRSVFQATSLIQGKLHQTKDRIDLIKACFPGGSITGAPKVRAMQIIAELEPHLRGPYTGALGYLDFNGNLDLNIIIRSIIIKNSRAYFQVGGGIVADSNPGKEYQETLVKAKGILEALKNV